MIPLLLILSTFVCASEPEFYVKTKQKVNGDWQFTLVNHGQIIADCTIKKNETCCCNERNKNCECQAMRINALVGVDPKDIKHADRVVVRVK